MGILRFLLAISVVINHSAPILGFELVGGQVAVQAFYIISGFYMSLILNEKYVHQTNAYSLFITNRFLRLYPIYWLVLSLTLLLSVGAHVYKPGTTLDRLAVYFQHGEAMGFGSIFTLILSNIVLFGQDIVMFLGVNLSDGSLFFTSDFRATQPGLFSFLLIPQAWTVGLELTFYLIAPFLVRRSLKVIVPIIVASLILRGWFYFGMHWTHDPWTYRFFPTELAFFLLGNVGYRVYERIKNREIADFIPYTLLGALLLFTVVYSFIPFEGKIFAYYALFFAALPFIFKKTKTWKRDYAIGDLSYPIYISHVLIINIVSSLQMHFPGRSLFIVVVSAVFAYFLNAYFGEKIEKIRQRRFESAGKQTKIKPVLQEA